MRTLINCNCISVYVLCSLYCIILYIYILCIYIYYTACICTLTAHKLLYKTVVKTTTDFLYIFTSSAARTLQTPFIIFKLRSDYRRARVCIHSKSIKPFYLRLVQQNKIYLKLQYLCYAYTQYNRRLACFSPATRPQYHNIIVILKYCNKIYVAES